jgi:uncharacterized RDD family membrane protein YckC
MHNILDTEPGQLAYAGFSKRFFASLIDGVIIFCVLVAPLIILAVAGASEETVSAGAVIIQLLAVVGSWIYEAVMDSSSKQGTLGKMAIGIKVTDLEGKRITFGRATGGHFGKYLSYFTMYIGYLMAAFTQKRQALHDIIAGTLVLED